MFIIAAVELVVVWSSLGKMFTCCFLIAPRTVFCRMWPLEGISRDKLSTTLTDKPGLFFLHFHQEADIRDLNLLLHPSIKEKLQINEKLFPNILLISKHMGSAERAKLLDWISV